MLYADKLRELADYLDNHPAVAEKIISRYERPNVWIACDEWEEFQSVISTLGGYEKSGAGGSLTAMHTREDEDFGEVFVIRVTVSNVCEVVPAVDEEGLPVMRKKQRYVETDEYEQVMEYKCPDVWSK